MLFGLWSFLMFIIAVLLLVTIHEFGHFIIARRLGVKVECFSIGFGKSLWHHTFQTGTRLQISALPFGGYVRMLDETEGDVNEDDKPFLLTQQSLPKRFAIVLAGPLFNFLFAFFAYFFMFLIGVKSPIALIGEVFPNSPAFHAGLTPTHEIIQVANRPTHNWTDVRLALISHMGKQTPLKVTVKKHQNALLRHSYFLTIPKRSHKDLLDPVLALGIKPFTPDVPPIIGLIASGKVADKAGLHAGDEIKAVNGQKLTSWKRFSERIKQSPGKEITLLVKKSNAEFKKIKLIPEPVQDPFGQTIGQLGVASTTIEYPDPLMHKEQLSPIRAVGAALYKTVSMSWLTLKLVGKLVVGHVSLANMSGPLGIAQGAGQSASVGLAYYLSFLALISISLGVINLLPIPVLDGGHILFYVYEAIRRKPLSEQVQQIGMRIGIGFILALMFIALYNDVARIISH